MMLATLVRYRRGDGVKWQDILPDFHEMAG
jgi:hypothetical protein